MQKKIMICFILCVTFIASMVLPVFAIPSDDPIQVKSYFAKPGSPPGLDKKPKPGDDSGASVDIRNVASGETVYSTVLIIAEVDGDFDSVFFEVNGGSEAAMMQVGTTNRYQISWNAVGDAVTLTVKAKKEGTEVGSASVDVTVATDFLYEVTYEIDYIAGHEPSDDLLTYWSSYWASRAIDVHYTKTNIGDPVQNDDGIITTTEFWQLEAEFNIGEDMANGNPNLGDYTGDEKWMLYGSEYSDSNVGGFTYVPSGGYGGNYIFIADEMIDDLETINDIPYDGLEVTVVCHEAGHSIGILVTRGRSEKYDPDRYSVMSTMTIENSKYMAEYWYYSKEYWPTSNLEYYIAVP